MCSVFLSLNVDWLNVLTDAVDVCMVDFICGLYVEVVSAPQVFMLKPSLSLRSTYLTQFLLLIHRKALTLLKYIEDET